MPIPSLLAVCSASVPGEDKERTLAIILESGEPREVHHFAALLDKVCV
ncbi:MAG: glutamate synthase central domain-containing protein [Blautia marasmi]